MTSSNSIALSLTSSGCSITQIETLANQGYSMRFLRFIKASGRWGMSLMTGGLFSYLAAFYEHVFARPISAVVWAFFGTAFLLVGAFLAWDAEERSRHIAQNHLQDVLNKERPVVFAMLDFSRTTIKGGHSRILLCNKGSSHAYNVRINPLVIGDRQYLFKAVAILNSGEESLPDFSWRAMPPTSQRGERGLDETFRDTLRTIIERGLTKYVSGDDHERRSTLNFMFVTKWRDYLGNEFASDTTATYEYWNQECTSIPGAVTTISR